MEEFKVDPVVIFDSVKWLTIEEIVMMAMYVITLILFAIPFKKDYKWFRIMPFIAVAAAIVSIVKGNMTYMAILLYTLTAAVFLFTLKRWFQSAPRKLNIKFNLLRLTVGLLGMLPILLILFVAGEMRYNPVSHYEKMSYSAAFTALHDRMKDEYPFGEWKNMNGAELQKIYGPIFQKADSEQDQELYYKTLRAYLFSFHDRHIEITNESQVFERTGC